jgi:hypothetical protein
MPEYGDIRDELDEALLVCVCCGVVLILDLHRWGLDWPDRVCGWRWLGEGYACPVCAGGHA